MQDIINEILKFRDQRNWNQFHNIKDLMMGLNIEVAELQELFLWKEEQDVDMSEVEKELSDIFIFLVYVSDHFNIDLMASIKNKMEIHKQHYPINLSKGKNSKYTEIKKDENNS